jgi:hypothetical protein
MSDHAGLLPAPKANQWLWAAAGTLALAFSAMGVLDPTIYDGLIPASLLPGILGQDITTIAVSVGLLVLAVVEGVRPRVQLVALGLVGYLFYAYGILVIERAYNELYVGYLVVFALATWTLVSAAVAIGRAQPDVRTPERWTRRSIVAGSAMQPLLFIPLWVAALLPLMAERKQIDSLYSIYILDLAVVMPAFLIAAVLTMRRRPAGLLLAAGLFVLGAALMLSLALSSLLGVGLTAAGLLPPLLLMVLFAGLAVLSLRLVGAPSARPSPPPGRADASDSRRSAVPLAR